MKKVITLVLVLAVVLSTAAASYPNYQKIYAVDDDILDLMVDLFLLSGHSLPSTTGPYSGSELKAMLSSLDYNRLGEYEKALYERIDSTLESDADYPVFKASLLVAPEAYINTNTSSPFFQTRDNWVRGWSDQKQFLNIITEEHIGSAFYGFFNFSLGVAKDHVSRSFGDAPLWSNIPFLLQNDMKELDFNFPLRAFVTAGGEHWSLFVGRDRLKWGNGKTGNFVIGDHIKYHNAAYFKAYEGNFKYTFLISAFPHPQNYYKVVDKEKNVMEYSRNGVDSGQSHYMNGISCFIAHRLEWNIIPSLSFTLTEGVMYMSKDNKIDLIAFAPAMMYHNNYTRANTNSILSFELDWTVIRGLNLYAQLVIDESVLPGEPNPGTTTKDLAEPNGRGLLIGATYKSVLNKGVLTFNVEGAVTDPYLYLRDGDTQAGESTREQTNGRYGINYVVALREMSQTGGTENYNLDFLGYKYGGDAIVAYLSSDYLVPGKWNAGGSFFFMAHGTHDKYTVWTRVTKDTNKTTPTTDHQTENYNDDNVSNRDSVAYSFVTSLTGSYSFLPDLTLSGEVDFIYLKNPGNISTSPSLFDIQTTIALNYTWR